MHQFSEGIKSRKSVHLLKLEAWNLICARFLASEDFFLEFPTQRWDEMMNGDVMEFIRMIESVMTCKWLQCTEGSLRLVLTLALKHTCVTFGDQQFLTVGFACLKQKACNWQGNLYSCRISESSPHPCWTEGFVLSAVLELAHSNSKPECATWI